MARLSLDHLDDANWRFIARCPCGHAGEVAPSALRRGLTLKPWHRERDRLRLALRRLRCGSCGESLTAESRGELRERLALVRITPELDLRGGGTLPCRWS